MLPYKLPTVHNVSITMPSPSSHSHIECTDGISATVPLTSLKLDKVDPIITRTDFSLVVPSLTHVNVILK